MLTTMFDVMVPFFRARLPFNVVRPQATTKRHLAALCRLINYYILARALNALTHFQSPGLKKFETRIARQGSPHIVHIAIVQRTASAINWSELYKCRSVFYFFYFRYYYKKIGLYNSHTFAYTILRNDIVQGVPKVIVQRFGLIARPVII